LDRTRDFEKYAIRPENYCRLAREEAKEVKENTPRSTSEVSTANSGGKMTPERMARIEALMTEISAMSEGRREPVHKLVGQMLMAGMTMREVEEQLHAWAGDARLHDHVDSAIERWERIWQDQQCEPASDNAAASKKTDQEQPHARPQGRWKPRTVSREQIEQWKREPKPLGESTIELVRDGTGETHSVMRPITEDDMERIERDHQRRQKACDRRRARKTNDLGIKMNWSL
jgi:hypothetical protein